MLEWIVFGGVFVVALGSSLAMLFSPNAVHVALFLVGTQIALADVPSGAPPEIEWRLGEEVVARDVPEFTLSPDFDAAPRRGGAPARGW